MYICIYVYLYLYTHIFFIHIYIYIIILYIQYYINISMINSIYLQDIGISTAPPLSAAPALLVAVVGRGNASEAEAAAGTTLAQGPSMAIHGCCG